MIPRLTYRFYLAWVCILASAFSLNDIINLNFYVAYGLAFVGFVFMAREMKIQADRDRNRRERQLQRTIDKYLRDYRGA